MIVLFYYVLKVIICSGLLFLYYHVALRNRIFHQWNRFYLLIATCLSLSLPLVKIHIGQTVESGNKAIHLLQAVNAADEYIADASGRTFFSAEQWIFIGCALISVLLFIQLLASFFKILAIRKRYPVQEVDDVVLIQTDVKETPFSFLNIIFWNRNIDLQSPNGQLILKHELIHVKEKHSLDKIFIQLVLIIGWCNPFFWLIRKELKMIHEFIADKKSVIEGDTSVLANMILQAVYPVQYSTITNSFFQTSIKRRLFMLTQHQHSRFRYIGRIMVLPLLALLAFAFTVKTKTVTSHALLEKGITVVIDAGHGGTDAGALWNTINEKDVTLALARLIQSENSNDQIHTALTRTGDITMPLQDRTTISANQHANLFISLHANRTEDKSNSGFEVLVSAKNRVYQQQSEVLGSILQEEINSIYPASPQLKKNSSSGVWVLDKNSCPAVLLECGYISNDKDRDFIIQPSNQQAIAQKILNSIERFATSKNSITIAANNSYSKPLPQKDTTSPRQYYKGKEVISVDVKKENKQIVIQYGDGTEETMSIEAAKKIKLLSVPPPPPPPPPAPVGTPAIPQTPAENVKEVAENVEKEKAVAQEEKQAAQKEKENAVREREQQKIQAQQAKAQGQQMKAQLKMQEAQYKKDRENGRVKEQQGAMAQSKFEGLYILDGTEYKGNIDDVDPNTIQSMNVLKGSNATDKYGEKGKKGVIEITTKQSK